MSWNRYSRNKYGSKKVEVDGIVFDSKKESRRYQELSLLEKSGEIQNLQRQVEYVLIPNQYIPTDVMVTKGKNAGQYKTKLVERKCSYIADFVYLDMKTGNTVVEDTKGFRTKDYIIKRKLMMYVHGIRITEI